MVRIIFCDLDDTLLAPQTKEVSANDMNAIFHWIETGHTFAIATARHYTFLNQITSKFKDHDFDCVGWNGAQIYINHKVVQQYPIDDHYIFNILHELKNYNCFLKATNINNEILFCHRHLSYLYDDIVLPSDVQKTISLEDYLKIDNHPSLIHLNYVFENSDQINTFYQDFQKSPYAQYLNCKRTSIRSYDITSYQATKERGIETYIKLKDIPLSEVAVIGDSLNDIGMMTLTRNSFCMSHGDLEAKQQAFMVVDSVADVIQYLLEEEIKSE